MYWKCIITAKNKISVSSFFTSEFMQALHFFSILKTIAVKGAIVVRSEAGKHTEELVKYSQLVTSS